MTLLENTFFSTHVAVVKVAYGTPSANIFFATFLRQLPKLFTLLSVVLWNLRQPISTSELCIAIYFVLLVLNHIEHPFIDKIFRFGFAATIVLNIGMAKKVSSPFMSIW